MRSDDFNRRNHRTERDSMRLHGCMFFFCFFSSCSVVVVAVWWRTADRCRLLVWLAVLIQRPTAVNSSEIHVRTGDCRNGCTQFRNKKNVFWERERSLSGLIVYNTLLSISRRQPFRNLKKFIHSLRVRHKTAITTMNSVNFCCCRLSFAICKLFDPNFHYQITMKYALVAVGFFFDHFSVFETYILLARWCMNWKIQSTVTSVLGMSGERQHVSRKNKNKKKCVAGMWSNHLLAWFRFWCVRCRARYREREREGAR